MIWMAMALADPGWAEVASPEGWVEVGTPETSETGRIDLRTRILC